MRSHTFTVPAQGRVVRDRGCWRAMLWMGKPDFDDSGWDNATQLDQFGSGIWGFGAATMRQTLKDPDSTAYWVWAGPNDVEDDVYFRKILGDLPTTLVEPGGKVTTTWGALKGDR